IHLAARAEALLRTAVSPLVNQATQAEQEETVAVEQAVVVEHALPASESEATAQGARDGEVVEGEAMEFAEAEQMIAEGSPVMAALAAPSSALAEASRTAGGVALAGPAWEIGPFQGVAEMLAALAEEAMQQERQMRALAFTLRQMLH